ncbi:MAG TPA: DNA-3-methyladenine glycosylase 2 family protein [Cyanobacteria bacterium UBA8803]|nr:DNA-3-methyladenine glycosylase 2 family protein [Cyanobacteria bacterium UBA9273]HBL59372.1 DNA-3-methyladenine glycosylase 2 family protein [Cyanobacteria bacterium UBA8803]
MNYAIAIDYLKNADPILGQLMDRIGACQLSQHELEGDLFFCLSRSILHQQLSTKVANIIHARFLQLYPDTKFPTARDILNTPDEVFRNIGISRPKISYLKDLARHAIDGLPTLEELEVLDDEEIIKILTQVKGIGRWTVQMLLIFRLQRWDVLPVDDLGVRAGIRQLYNLEALPDRKTTEAFGKKWQPYCSIASWYLWRSLELKLVT